MEQFKFQNLRDDHQLEILKYMLIKERVRFERVTTNWANLLDKLWLSQKQLAFCSGVSRSPASGCHSIGRIDCLYQRRMPDKAMFKIISRCKNLIALEFSNKIFSKLDEAKKLALNDSLEMSAQLANVLDDNCKELEHLDIPDINKAFFELFTPSDKFTCLIPSTYDRLKILYGKKMMPDKLLALKTVNFRKHFYRADEMTLDLINTASVENLVINRWNDKCRELINLKSLTWLSIMFNSILPDTVENFNKLERISLAATTTTQLRRIFENNCNLVSLKLSISSDEVMDTIVEFGLNLTELSIDFGEGADNATFKYYTFWQHLSKLTNLRSLSIVGCGLRLGVPGMRDIAMANSNNDIIGLCLVLRNCTKLKYFRFSCKSRANDITTEGEKEQIRSIVANKSSRQLFVVTFAKFRGNGHLIVVERVQSLYEVPCDEKDRDLMYPSREIPNLLPQASEPYFSSKLHFLKYFSNIPGWVHGIHVIPAVIGLVIALILQLFLKYLSS